MSTQSVHTCWVIGASGYSGAQLCELLNSHPHLQLSAAYASSTENAVALSVLYPALANVCDIHLQVWDDAHIADHALPDVVFLALPHEISARLAPVLLNAGTVVVDLSGAYRLRDPHKYPEFYNFQHPFPALLERASYCLIENMIPGAVPDDLISVPGCYPTVSSLALLPLCQGELLDSTQIPVITATSGVSGAGRKASLKTSFCEVSLQAYSLLCHRHVPEIEQNLGREIIFTPQLGNFKRGILATCAARLAPGVNLKDVVKCMQDAYANCPLVRLCPTPPSLDQVVHTPFCDIHVAVQGNKVVLSAAIDNLMKGAASQAIQAANQKFGWPTTVGLLP
ncbi:N-acetyl-gamma-glutamyl-phosphate reductase [Aliidiomarina sp. Khilg15.8]